jgi:Zn-dependent protease/CBS domain-containing protein
LARHHFVIMKYSFKISSVWGIPIEVHLTFILLMIGVFALTFPDTYLLVLVLFLFVFVVVHELAHSWVARRYGIKVRKIVLYPIGGISEIEEIPDNPRIEWRMAIAGPITSFIVGALLLALNQVIAIETPEISGLAVTGSLLFTLGMLNLFLGAFNLIPAFPMDGGRVFRAILAEHMKHADATKYAAYLGRILGIVMAVLGFIFNFWLIIIGAFIYIGASEETESTIVSTTIARVRVKDVMDQEKGVAGPETTVSEALEIMFKSRYHDVLVENDGLFVGVVAWNDIMKVKPEQREELQVGKLPMKKLLIFDDESVLEAYKIMRHEKIDLLPVVNREATDIVIGIITNESIASSIEKAKTLR